MIKARAIYRISVSLSLMVHIVLLIYALRNQVYPTGHVLFVLDTRAAVLGSFCIVGFLHVVSLLDDHLDPIGPIRRDLFSGVVLVGAQLLLLYLTADVAFIVVLLTVLFFAFSAVHYSLILIGVLYVIYTPAAWVITGLGGNGLYQGLLVLLPPVSLGVSYVVRSLIAELVLERESAGRARYTATEFVKMNLRLHHTASAGEIKGMQQERMRLAREIHDTVGHALTAILMQTRLVRAAVETGAEETSDVSDELCNLEELSLSTIEDVRREVSSLRGRSLVRLSWLVRWRALCRSFADSTGTTVIISIPDLEGPVSDEIGETVFRVLQESLTNSIRHGRASIVDVRMLAKPTEHRLYVRVSDNGRGAKTVAPGNGLAGIRERVEALHGEVAWQTLPNRGFDIGIDLPIRNGHGQNIGTGG